ncbi:MAG TPA: class I SAM-dependent methyltransferase [Kofleriaceae bacterium]|nr:class I SAM-dependent methyltransferase [Kofleriaceae bacterium]
MFCALAAARVYRSDGCLAVDEVGALDGWSSDGSLAKQLANEFEFGAGIIQQLGRGGDAQLRLRMPAAEIQVGELPDTVQQLFNHPQSTSLPIDDLLPQPIVDRELATAVAEALRGAAPDLTLVVRPAYQGGRSSLAFRGLAVKSLGATRGRPAATTVLVKVPLGISGGKLAVAARALDHERRLLAALAGWPGLPARVESHRVDLRGLGDVLRRHHRIHVHDDALAMDVLVLPLGHPRTTEAEPRTLHSIIYDTARPMRRLSRRDIHNLLTLAGQLGRLLRMLHRERRAHRHVLVDAVIVRYELGIFESVLAPDLANSVQTPRGSDDLLFRDLFDLGRVLVHVITGTALSRERQNFQPPEFPGRRLTTRLVVGEGETVARLLFCVSRYLLEAAPSASADEDQPTVALLDHFLDEIEHIDMLHRARARGVPERRVSLAGATPAAQSPVPPREIWDRSTADPVATWLVTISHLVDPSTLRRWCERYATNQRWYARRDAGPAGAPPSPSADDCLRMMRDGFGRSSAAEMWRYLWGAGPDEPADRLVRVLRNYATHWVREGRFDVAHAFAPPAPEGRAASRGLADELGTLRQRWASQPERRLLVDWVDVLGLLSPRNRGATEQRREAALAAERAALERAAGVDPATAREYERLRSWLRVGTLMQQLQSRTAPSEQDVRAVERALDARSAPEIAFWHVLLARAWATAAAHGAPAETDDDPAWDRAMRALLIAVGAAASRKLPFETAATLLAAAALTGLALATPELRAGFASQGVDEESVRVQAAECALLAADAYQWLDAEHHHGAALLEAAALLQGSASPERLIHALQLVGLARNNRVLYRAHHPGGDAGADPPAPLERYPLGDDGEPGRSRRERTVFDEASRVWLTAASRSQTSDDPATVVAHGFFSRYLPGVRQLFRSSALSACLQIELDDPARPARAVDRLLELAGAQFGPLPVDRILDFGCGAGDDARYLASHLARRHQVWAVDSPLWLAATGAPSAADGPHFLALDPVDYARRICDGRPPDGSPAEVDVVLFRCSLCRITQRALLLDAAHRLLRPGGLVIATDWIQTRVTDRITWSRMLGAARFVDLETEPGYRRLCSEQRFVDFVSWDWTAEPGASAPAMQRWAQRRLDEVRRLEDEHGRPPRSPHERAFLLRFKRDLEALAALSTADGPLGWLFWAARTPGRAA